MKKAEQRSIQFTEVTKSDTPDEQSNPRVINVTEEWLGKSIAIVGFPPPVKAAATDRLYADVGVGCLECSDQRRKERIGDAGWREKPQ